MQPCWRSADVVVYTPGSSMRPPTRELTALSASWAVGETSEPLDLWVCVATTLASRSPRF
jgi:hypothetical protein